MKKISLAIVSLLTIAILSACAGGVSKTTINGKTTYRKDGQEITREQAAAENSYFAEELAQEKRETEFAEALKNAPRRTASEPVSIALLEPIVPAGKNINKAKLNDYWRRTFKKQKKLPLVKRKKIRAAMKGYASVSQSGDWLTEARAKKVPGDAYVQLIVTTADVFVKNKKTKKISAQTILVFRAEIGSPYLGEKIVLDEKVVNVLKNVEHLNTLAANTRGAVRNQLRPRLPSTRWLKEQNKSGLEALLQALKAQTQSE